MTTQEEYLRYSESLIPTLKETPAEAEVISHKLMMRAGFIRKLAAGVYIYLPLSLRVFRKIEEIVRDEMAAAGAMELLLPIVMPAELWVETGRWDFYGKELLRFKDRHDREFCIGPTHEEAITDLARREIKSYRDLPKNLFQIQTKFRDEIRPRFGLMRGREFVMKDGYSFDTDEAASKVSYKKMYDAYMRIFSRCGLEFRPVEAATGAIGGTLSHEFQVIAESGEDAIFFCDKCDYAASYERARTIKEDELKTMNEACEKGARHPASQVPGTFSQVSTPSQKTVEEVAAFLKCSAHDLVKTMLYKVTETPEKSFFIAALVRGDDEVVEPKLVKALFDNGYISKIDVQLEMADEASVRELTKAPVGFAGPIGLAKEVKIIADSAVHGGEKMVVGANKNDAHLTGISWKDCNIEKFVDIRRAREGDACACEKCKGHLKEKRGIEVGQVFFLGTKYSEPMKATYLDESGVAKPFVMGCYGIGISRTAASAIEQNHDEKGMKWPIQIAPFHCHLIELSGKDANAKKYAEEVYCELKRSGIEVLYDDRDQRPGVKFADADLIGIPYQLIVGSRTLESKNIEVKDRRTGEKFELKLDKIIEKISGEVRDARTPTIGAA